MEGDGEDSFKNGISVSDFKKEKVQTSSKKPKVPKEPK